MGYIGHDRFHCFLSFFFPAPFHMRARSLFITLIAHEGEDIVIQGIICLIGAISHPVLYCQMAAFPWSLPVFTVTCHGRALPATLGFQHRGMDNISVPRLEVWGLSPLLPPALHAVPSPGASALPLLAPFLDRHG